MNQELEEFIDYILNTDIKNIKLHDKNIDIEFDRFNGKGNDDYLINDTSPIELEKKNSGLSAKEAPKRSIGSNFSNSDHDLIIIKSPMVGIFHIDEQKSHFEKNEALGQIESMKVFTDIKSPEKVIVRKILVKNGEAVEYNQPLLEIEKEE